MESIKLALLRLIQENMPDIITIDEDYGQLEYPDDQYPIVYPAVLFSMGETDWTTISLKPTIQDGDRLITVKLAFDCYDDTHAGSTTEHKIEAREKKAHELFQLIQGWKPKKGIAPFTRIKDGDYSLQGGIKVYEITFKAGEKYIG